ncbi:hypothetical protein JCM19233_6844 [Vibrio astriarenae]|nr:hypothetical protein JCM19233_6844 [Vibrio sp. C7]
MVGVTNQAFDTVWVDTQSGSTIKEVERRVKQSGVVENE